MYEAALIWFVLCYLAGQSSKFVAWNASSMSLLYRGKVIWRPGSCVRGPHTLLLC